MLRGGALYVSIGPAKRALLPQLSGSTIRWWFLARSKREERRPASDQVIGKRG
jgi:hypothetical protein